MITLTIPQARKFLLLKHGLTGPHRFQGREGAMAFIRQTGCIQFDPVDLCGQNAQITLQSRVKNFTKSTLEELLYKDRLLVDYPDKNLSIMPTTDWPYFRRYRQAAIDGGKRFEGLADLEAQALEYIQEHGPVNSDELPLEGNIRWQSSIHWSGSWNSETKASRAVLEQLYSTGQLVIHHKKGSRKYYDIAENHIPQEILQAPDPLPDDFEHQKWRILRRIGAVGLLWNRPSDAWLYIQNLSTSRRGEIFRALQDEERIAPIAVEGISHTFYIHSEDLPLLETVIESSFAKTSAEPSSFEVASSLQADEIQNPSTMPSMQGYSAQIPKGHPRCEVIAVLDCFMWDRKLIHALFDFHFSWEIYTPAIKRKYGPYVLPLIYGDAFIGRVEAVRDSKTKTLVVKNIWLEDAVRKTKKLQAAIGVCLKRFAKFNHCDLLSDYVI